MTKSLLSFKLNIGLVRFKACLDHVSGGSQGEERSALLNLLSWKFALEGALGSSPEPAL